jgi:hypothetical protein
MQCQRNVSAHNNSQADGAEDVIRRSIPSRTFIVLSPKRARFAVAARICVTELEFDAGDDGNDQAASVKASCTEDWTEPPVTAPPPAT